MTVNHSKKMLSYFFHWKVGIDRYQPALLPVVIRHLTGLPVVSIQPAGNYLFAIVFADQ
jgi:hypothetical protein